MMKNIEISLNNLAKTIQSILNDVDYIKVYGTFTFEKNVQNVISRNIFLEVPTGDIYQDGEWDSYICKNKAESIKLLLSEWTNGCLASFPDLEEKTALRASFFLDRDSINISDFLKEDYEIDHFQRSLNWIKKNLPKEPVPSYPPWEQKENKSENDSLSSSKSSIFVSNSQHKNEKGCHTVNYDKIENLIPEMTQKIKSFLPFEVKEHYVYVQWNNQKEEVQCEVGVFLKNDSDEVFHIDLLENHGVDRDKIIEFTFELEDTVHHFMKQGGKVDYVEFAYSSKNQNQFDVLRLNFDLNSPLDYPIRQKKWLKEMFDSSVKLPIHYQIDTILSEPNEEYTPKISKNFLVRNGAPIQHSRFLGNHVKVLNNAEIKVYAKLLKRFCNQKLEPFLIVNTGNIFVYSKKENRIYIYFPSDDYCMDLMTATPDNINYLIEGYFSELSRIKLVFNSDLLEHRLKEDEILYAPSFSNQDTTSFMATEMKNAIELLASGM